MPGHLQKRRVEGKNEVVISEGIQRLYDHRMPRDEYERLKRRLQIVGRALAD